MLDIRTLFSMLVLSCLLAGVGVLAMRVPAERRGFGDIGDASALVAGTPLPKPEGVFPRHVDPAAA